MKTPDFQKNLFFKDGTYAKSKFQFRPLQQEAGMEH
jgi:hypothetical protein